MWNCLPCICSPDAEGEFLPTCDLDTLQSGLSRSRNIPDEFCCNDNLTEFFQCFQFGTILERSEQTILSAEISSIDAERSETSSPSAEDFHAKTSARQAKARALTEQKAASGERCRVLLAKYDRNSCSWRTQQLCLFGGLIEFSEKWPRWGMIQNGELYLEQMPSGLMEIQQLITNAKESGLLVNMRKTISVPTPTCDGYKSDGDLRILFKNFDENEALTLCSRAAKSKKQKAMSVRRRELTRRFPTLHGFSKDGKSNEPSGNELGRTIDRSLRVPTVTKHNANEFNSPKESERNTPSLASIVQGIINPNWVEFLMGFPIGWTSMQPLPKLIVDNWVSSSAMWAKEPSGVPRVAKGIKNASSRIEGLGNAQIPSCAEMAWRILADESDK